MLLHPLKHYLDNIALQEVVHCYLKQQQMQQQMKAMQQPIYLEQLKREEEASVAKARLEVMSGVLCWGRFDNISAARDHLHLRRRWECSYPGM